jgi:hypothetical protein
MVNASSTTRLDIWLRIAKIKLNKETLKQQFQVVMSLYLCNKTFMHEEYNVFHLQISGW